MTSIRLMWFIQPPVAAVASGLGLVAPDAALGVRNRSSDEQFEALASGNADVVVTAMDNVIAWNRRTGPGDFRIVAQIERTTPLHLVSRLGVETLADLRGGTLLVDAPDNGFVIAARALLAQAGLGEDDYALLPAGGVKERLDALLAGQGTCTLLGPPFDAVALQAGCVRMATLQQHYPAFPGQGLVIRKSSIEALRARLVPWLHALETASRLLGVGDPAALQAMEDAGYPAASLPAMAELRPRSIVPDRKGVELLIAQRRQLGLTGADDTYDTLVDLSLLHPT